MRDRPNISPTRRNGSPPRWRSRFAVTAVALLILAWWFAPMIAGDVPIVCRLDGRYHAPAVVEVLRGIPLVGSRIKQAKPFGLAGFDARSAFGPDDFALWPPIPFGPMDTGPDSFAPPSRRHWLGTDEVGRDIGARLVHGAAVSIKVGLVSMGIAGVIGMMLGALAGYFGGWVDQLVSRLIEIVICFPVLFLILSVVVWLKPNIVNVMVVIGLTRWTDIARYTRGECLRLKREDFVQAARACGAGHLRIITRHLLPNALSPVIVALTFGMAQAILIEAGLSWLGFGVQWPEPSWGNMLKSAFDHIRSAPHLLYPPCVAIFLAVLAYNLLGDALQDRLDPRSRAHA